MISKIENKKVLLVLLAKGDGLQHKFNMEQYEDDKYNNNNNNNNKEKYRKNLLPIIFNYY